MLLVWPLKFSGAMAGIPLQWPRGDVEQPPTFVQHQRGLASCQAQLRVQPVLVPNVSNRYQLRMDEDMVGTLNQEGAQVGIALLGDM